MNVAELEFEGSHEEQWGTMKTTVKQLHAAVNGNGQPGILDFVSGMKAQLRLLVVLMTLVGLIVSILALLEGARQLHGNFSHTSSTSTSAVNAASTRTTY